MGNCNLNKVEIVTLIRAMTFKQSLRMVTELARYLNIWRKCISGRGQDCIWDILGTTKIFVRLMWSQARLEDIGKESRDELKEPDHVFSFPCLLTVLNIFPCAIRIHSLVKCLSKSLPISEISLLLS